jgi:hypothetical protein
MAVYGMRVSQTATLGFDGEDTGWFDEHPDTAIAFERFCTGPVRPDLLLPLEDRPLTRSLALDDAEEAALSAGVLK